MFMFKNDVSKSKKLVHVYMYKLFKIRIIIQKPYLLISS